MIHRKLATFGSTLSMFLLLSLAGCGGEHPLHGNWHQHLAGGGHGMSLAFDPDSERMQVHLADRPDGGHDHAESATYRLEGTKVTVQWTAPDGAQVSMTGELREDTLTLTGPDGALEFERSAEGRH